jgi:hypothetical protein
MNKEMKFDKIFSSLNNQSKIFKNTEKILHRLSKNKNWVEREYNLIEELFFDEMGYVSKILMKLSNNLNKKRFKEEIINNLFIFKENFKIFVEIMITEFFDQFISEVNKSDAIMNFQEKSSKNHPKTNMESIQEVNEEILEISEKSVQNLNEFSIDKNLLTNNLSNGEVFIFKNTKQGEKTSSSKEIKKINISSETKKDVSSKKYRNKSLSKIKNITPSNYITNFIYLNYGINKKIITAKKIVPRKQSKSFKTNTNVKKKEDKIKNYKT